MTAAAMAWALHRELDVPVFGLHREAPRLLLHCARWQVLPALRWLAKQWEAPCPVS